MPSLGVCSPWGKPCIFVCWCFYVAKNVDLYYWVCQFLWSIFVPRYLPFSKMTPIIGVTQSIWFFRVILLTIYLVMWPIPKDSSLSVVFCCGLQTINGKWEVPPPPIPTMNRISYFRPKIMILGVETVQVDIYQSEQ